jgi:hypothetical protein
MTNEEINKIIAEYCGWKYEFNGNHEDPEWYWIPPNNPDGNGTPPDYCNDLNEMHDAEKYILDFSRFGRFGDELAKVVLGHTGTPEDITLSYWALQRVTHANGRQRAEAFVKTIGKWH